MSERDSICASEEKLEGEEWRPVVGLEGRYEVSNAGRMRSLLYPNGKLRPIPKVLRLSNHNGYPTLRLTRNGVSKCFRLSRAVLQAFVGPAPSSEHEAAHWDGNTLNNTLANLRWATPKENSDDKLRHGTMNYGRRNGIAKVDEDTGRRMVEMLESGMLYADIARALGFNRMTVSLYLRGRTYCGDGQVARPNVCLKCRKPLPGTIRGVQRCRSCPECREQHRQQRRAKARAAWAAKKHKTV